MHLSNNLYSSWGRYPHIRQKAYTPFWRDQVRGLLETESKILPYGLGRTYGDVCLSEKGPLINFSNLNKIVAFDPRTGVFECEAGMSFAEILQLVIPHGWSLPVTPGTKFVTVGGAIANDVHGKNHHQMGTFGCHVKELKLLRSDCGVVSCSQETNPDLFAATIGGLGLSGVILTAKFQLKKIDQPHLYTETIKFNSLKEFFEVNEEFNKFEYTVSWVDSTKQGHHMARGLFMAGANCPGNEETRKLSLPKAKIFPIEAPSWFLNSFSTKAFNFLYFHKQLRKRSTGYQNYESFFYPLDSLQNWNRIYGKRGFLQYQFVVPHSDGYEVVKEIFSLITRSKKASFLSVLKVFGDIQSPGLLSFPIPGITLAMDFPFQGPSLLSLLNELDQIVLEAGGRVYPAKDSRMSAQSFKAFFPNWYEIEKLRDRKINSLFWQRVTGS